LREMVANGHRGQTGGHLQPKVNLETKLRSGVVSRVIEHRGEISPALLGKAAALAVYAIAWYHNMLQN